MINLDAQITQFGFGELVGISQPAVSDLLARKVLTEGATAGVWLHEYCRNLRETAAGRVAEGQLSKERALLAREQRERIAMQNAVVKGKLAPRVMLVQAIERVAPRVCGMLESIVPALRRRSGYSAEDLAYVEQVIADARKAITKMNLDGIVDAPDVAVPDGDEEAAA